MDAISKIAFFYITQRDTGKRKIYSVIGGYIKTRTSNKWVCQ
mgnify:FL=1